MLRIVLIAVLVLLAGLLVLWNAGPVPLRFLNWTIRLPAVAIIFLSFSAGLLTSILFLAARSDKTRGKKTDTSE
jgi:uncharacterized integral membrane protein